MCANVKTHLCVSSTCLASFSLVWSTVVFRMSIYMSCLQPRSGDVEGCVWVVLDMHTSMILTHDVVEIIRQSISSVALVARTVGQSHWVFFSWWFEVSCCRVKLRVCSQGHTWTSSLIHTLGQFAKVISTGPSSNNWTFVELHCTVSALIDYVLMPRITQSMRLPPKQSALHNPRIKLTDCLPK